MDDYVDDYTIAKVHNITSPKAPVADDDEETYAYADVGAEDLYDAPLPVSEETSSSIKEDPVARLIFLLFFLCSCDVFSVLFCACCCCGPATIQL